jgi:hypothetical protein
VRKIRAASSDIADVFVSISLMGDGWSPLGVPITREPEDDDNDGSSKIASLELRQSWESKIEWDLRSRIIIGFRGTD